MSYWDLLKVVTFRLNLDLFPNIKDSLMRPLTFWPWSINPRYLIEDFETILFRSDKIKVSISCQDFQMPIFPLYNPYHDKHVLWWPPRPTRHRLRIRIFDISPNPCPSTEKFEKRILSNSIESLHLARTEQPPRKYANSYLGRNWKCDHGWPPAALLR